MSNSLVQRMIEVIETEYANVVTLRRLSTMMGRQPAYLGRLFRHETGSTVRDYLTRIRLEHAEALIRDGVKIEAVALGVGYRSKKNFYQQFRRRYGTTPVPFRLDVNGATADPNGRPGEMTFVDGEPLMAMTAMGEVAGCAGQPAARAGLEEVEPVLDELSTMMRASNRAWRLAVQIQRVMAERFDRSQVPMLVTDDEGRYVAANPAAISLTGYSVLELRQLPPSSLFPTALACDTRCTWQLLLSIVQRPPASTSVVLRSKAGDLIRVQLVTLRNWLWGSSDMSSILNPLQLTTT